MRVGAENKKELRLMVVLLAIAIPLLVYNFRDFLFGSASAANVPMSSLPATATKTGPTLPSPADDPRLRTDILADSRKVKYEAGGRDIFRMEAPRIEPVKPVRAKGEYTVIVPPTPTPTPPPPPIPITYYGYASRPGEPKRIFLQKTGEEDVFVVGQGDIVARRYKVVQIQPTSVTMEDVFTKNQQAIHLTQK